MAKKKVKTKAPKKKPKAKKAKAVKKPKAKKAKKAKAVEEPTEHATESGASEQHEGAQSNDMGLDAAVDEIFSEESSDLDEGIDPNDDEFEEDEGYF